MPIRVNENVPPVLAAISVGSGSAFSITATVRQAGS